MNKENYNNGHNVQDILTEDETILWQGKPNKKAYISSLIIGFTIGILVVALVTGVLFLFTYISNFNIIACIFSALVVCGSLTIIVIEAIKLIPDVLKVKNIEYVVTDKRVLYKSGLIGMDYNSLSYQEVSNVSIDVGLLDKLFKVGTVKLLAGSASISIYHINNCYDLYKKLYKIVLDIQTDIKYPNALRPDENPGYKTKYKNEE